MKGKILNEEEMEELAGSKEFSERTKGTDETWDSTKTFDYALDNGYLVLQSPLTKRYFFFLPEAIDK